MKDAGKKISGKAKEVANKVKDQVGKTFGKKNKNQTTTTSRPAEMTTRQSGQLS